MLAYRISSSEEFWYKKVLELNVEWKWQESEDNPLEGSYKAFVVTEGEDATSWSNWGNCNWKIAGCLLLCWTLVCLSLIKGVQSYGKVVYFTTLFPYGSVALLSHFAKCENKKCDFFYCISQ